MKKCFICGSTRWIERHHVFGGPNRKLSEKYGLVADLCHYCHNEPPNGAHFNSGTDLYLKRYFQREFEKTHTRAEFMALIGKNYL